MNNFCLSYLKNNDPKKVLSKQGIAIRKMISPVYIKIAAKTNPYELIIDEKIEKPEGVPIIYVPTHFFKDDALNTMTLIKSNAYILFGSLPQFYNTLDGILAWINGVFIVDRKNKSSREASISKMEYGIDLGADIVYLAEGVWNKRMQTLVLKLFSGIYKVAKKKHAMIVPIALHVDPEKPDKCYASQGAAFDISKYDEKEGLLVLRDILATMKWHLIEKYSSLGEYTQSEREKLNIADDIIYKPIKRSDFAFGQNTDKAWDNYIESIIAETDYYDLDIEEKAEYREKGEASPEEVYEIFDNVEITPENASVVGPIKKLRKEYHSKYSMIHSYEYYLDK